MRVRIKIDVTVVEIFFILVLKNKDGDDFFRERKFSLVITSRANGLSIAISLAS